MPPTLTEPRFSTPVAEDFYRLNDALERGIALDSDSLFSSEQGGLFMRTAILGETWSLIQTTPEKRFSYRGHLKDRDYLALHYSRFFRLAGWLQLPPGPLPLTKNELSLEVLYRYGMYFDVRRDGALLHELGREIHRLSGSDLRCLSEMGELFPGLRFMGLQILDAAFQEYKLVLYFEADKVGALRDIVDLLFPSALHYEGASVECFVRRPDNSHFYPLLNPWLESREETAPEPVKVSKITDSASASKKLVFKQSGLTPIQGSLICLKLQLDP